MVLSGSWTRVTASSYPTEPAMAPVQLADDFSGGDIQGREQRRGALVFVIVCTALGYAGANGIVG